MSNYIDKAALDAAKGIRPLGFIDMPAIQKGLVHDEIKVLKNYLTGVVNNGVIANPDRSLLMSVVYENYHRMQVINKTIIENYSTFLLIVKN